MSITPITPTNPVILGLRAEDCTVGGEAPHLTGTVFGVEPAGDLTYLTLKAEEKLIKVRPGGATAPRWMRRKASASTPPACADVPGPTLGSGAGSGSY